MGTLPSSDRTAAKRAQTAPDEKLYFRTMPSPIGELTLDRFWSMNQLRPVVSVAARIHMTC
jgi:hypothetical protein